MIMVDLSDLNWLHIGVATLSGMILGWVWYSPLLFGRQWMKAAKVTKKQLSSAGNAPAGYAKAMIGHFIAAIALAELVHVFVATDLWEGVQVGLLVGVGLFAALTLVHLSFRTDKTLTLINATYDVAVVVMMAGLLAML